MTPRTPRYHLDDEDTRGSWLEVIPQILFVAFIVILVCVVIYDYETVWDYTNKFIDWVRENPL